jgi:PAS domain S-box-containing protein
LTTELDMMIRLHAMASQFVRDGDLPALLSAAIETAMAIVGADSGYIATVAAPAGALKLAAHRGFERSFVERWGASPRLAPSERLVVEDLLALRTGEAVGASARDLLVTTGLQALQATPLRGQSGKIVGLLSTHHRAPRSVRQTELRLIDLVARQCTDAIERAAWIEECAVSSARLQEDKLRETQALFRTTVENMPNNLALYARDGRVVYVNPALTRFSEGTLKLPLAEILGRHGEEVWPPAIWNPLRRHIDRAIATAKRQSYELALELPGERRSVRKWTVVPLADPDGEIRQILVMSHDITAQHRLVDELREADERKSAFIGMLSHELRNPLAAIRTNLYVLEHATAGNETAERTTKVIDRQIGYLVGMVDDLLDVTRITQNRIELRRERLEVNALVRETIEDNRAHLERGGVTFAAPLAGRPLYVNADGARIAQVVTNLLANAAKFTPAGGAVRVSVSASDDRWAVLSVADSGSGIEPSLLPHLFQPFMQGDHSLDRQSGGLGLGLALVKGLVELHGGDVSARSGGPGQGAEFVVRLPLDEAVRPNRGASRATGAPKRVLVIEDDLEIAEGLKAALQISHHVVEIARSGLGGLDKARAFMPDAVLCDIGLPGMDGYAVARAIRADSALRSTFLIALSGYAQAEDVAKARAAGFDRHLAKPASVGEIQRLLVAAGAAGNDEDLD